MFITKLKSILTSKTIKNKQKIKTPKENILSMSDYINLKLYSEEHSGYYSSKNKNPIGKLIKPMDLCSLRGMKDYELKLDKLYPSSSWVTASETLYPYYGYIISNYILSKRSLIETRKQKEGEDYVKDKEENLKIVEIGCGVGGLIDSILEYMKKMELKIYKNMEYVAFDSNDYFIDTSKRIISEKYKKKNEIEFIKKSIFDINISLESEGGREVKSMSNNDLCFILIFNLLNSLPHNRIRILNKKRLLNIIEASIKHSIDEFERISLKKQSFQEYFQDLLSHLHQDECTKEDNAYHMYFFILNETISLLSTQNHDGSLHFLLFFKKFLGLFMKESIKEDIISINFVDLTKKTEVFLCFNDILHMNLSDKSSIDYYLNTLSQTLRSLSIYYFPYDLIVLTRRSTSNSNSNFKQDWFIKLIKSYYNIHYKDYLWLPSQFDTLFYTLNDLFPNGQYIINDFDFLFVDYKSKYKGVNMPSAYSLIDVSNDSVNHLDLIDYHPKERKYNDKEALLGPMNIYFPIDFLYVQKVMSLVIGKEFTIAKNRMFMKEYELDWMDFKTGFNPLVETHSNCCFIYNSY